MKNPRALITGASSGIGYDMAIILAQKGYDLVLVARREERLQELKTKILALPQCSTIKIDLIPADLCDPQAPQKIFKATYPSEQSHPISLLINNAGSGKYRFFADQSAQDITHELQLNITSLTLLTHLFLPSLKAQKNQTYIGNVGSIASYMPAQRFSVYTGTKHYVRVFSQILGFELRHTNVSVTCICPGGTTTEFSEHAGQALKTAGQSAMMTSRQVAELGLKGLFAKKSVVTTGLLNQLTVLLSQFLPTWIMLRLVAFAMDNAVKPTDTA